MVAIYWKYVGRLVQKVGYQCNGGGVRPYNCRGIHYRTIGPSGKVYELSSGSDLIEKAG